MLTLRSSWLPLLLFLASSCGGSTEDASPADGGTSPGDEVTPDSAVEAGACSIEGPWLLSLSAEVGQPQQETIEIAAAPDAGPAAFRVTFEGRTVPVDSCGLPSDAGPETQTAAGALDAETCTLTASFTNSYCYSGEQQCHDFQLTLRFDGATAAGTASDTGGWCMDQHTSIWDATAQRFSK